MRKSEVHECAKKLLTVTLGIYIAEAFASANARNPDKVIRANVMRILSEFYGHPTAEKIIAGTEACKEIKYG